jgi:SAM-dependent methyltransferase
MHDDYEAIARQWKGRGDMRRITADLERRGRDLSRALPADLQLHDQLHAGLLEATELWADWIGDLRDRTVLDVGAGLGGAARHLAAERGARVEALELLPELSRAGEELTRSAGLSDRVRHLQCAIEDLESERRYDVICIQHVDIQLADKPLLYRRCRELLGDGGRVVWHDWLAGGAGPPRYPLFWSSDGTASHLVEKPRFEQLLSGAGLRLNRFEEISERTVVWFSGSQTGLRKVIGRLEESGDDGRLERLRALLAEVENALWGMNEERLLPFFGEAVAAPRDLC